MPLFKERIHTGEVAGSELVKNFLILICWQCERVRALASLT